MINSIAILDRIIKELKAKKPKLDSIIKCNPLQESFKVRNELHELLFKEDKNHKSAKERRDKILALEKRKQQLDRILKKDISKIIHESFVLEEEIEECQRLKMDLELKNKQFEAYNNFYSKGGSK